MKDVYILLNNEIIFSYKNAKKCMDFTSKAIEISEEHNKNLIMLNQKYENGFVNTVFLSNGNCIDISDVKESISDYFNKQIQDVSTLNKGKDKRYDYKLFISLDGEKEKEIDILEDESLNDLIISKAMGNNSYIVGYFISDNIKMNSNKYSIGTSFIEYDGPDKESTADVNIIDLINEYKSWEIESEMWYDFYTAFGKANFGEAIDYFDKNGLNNYTSKELHKENVKMFLDLIIEDECSLEDVFLEVYASEIYKDDVLEAYNEYMKDNQETLEL